MSCTFKELSAVHDSMPPRPPRLRVTLELECPQAGYQLHLFPKQPPGINPKDLLLELVQTPPDFGPDVVTEETVQWEIETDVEYDTVSIDGGPSAEVEQVS